MKEDGILKATRTEAIREFRLTYNNLIDTFMEKYYDDEDCDKEEKAYCEDGYLEISERIPYLHPIIISDDFWGISDIYLALMLDIPRKIVHSRYSDNLDAGMEDKPFMNLYHYYLKNK